MRRFAKEARAHLPVVGRLRAFMDAATRTRLAAAPIEARSGLRLPPSTGRRDQRARREESGRRREAGLTVVEVAMAVMVLAIAITTGLAAMQRAFLQLDTARNLQIAGGILQGEMEKERLLPWATVSDAAYQPAIDAALLKNAAVAGRFTLSRTLAIVADRDGQLVQVTLTVKWRTFDGRTAARTYTTFFCQDGLYNWVYSNV